MKLYKINIALHRDEFYSRAKVYEAKETDKSYLFFGNRISKDKIMKIDTMFYENHRTIMYHMWCLEDQKDEAFEKLLNHCKEKIMHYKAEVDEKVAMLDKHFIKEIKEY